MKGSLNCNGPSSMVSLALSCKFEDPLTCFKVPLHSGMDVCSGEIQYLEKIVEPISKDQCDGNKNLKHT